MKSLILAAGRGSRMGALTDRQPKCTTRLSGRTLLDWQVAALSAAQLEPIALVTGYRAAGLASYGSASFHNPRWERTNMVQSLLCARSWLEEPCVVAYADIVYHPSIPRELMKSSADVAISYDACWRSLWDQRFARPIDDAETFEIADDGRITEIGGKARTLDAIEGQYMGLLKLSPAALVWIDEILESMDEQERDALDMTGLLQRLIAAGSRVVGVRAEGRWCEVDSEDDLDCYEARLRGTDAWLHDWRW